MPYCKFCGDAVTSSPVWHSECWEKKVDEIATKFCDGFCHWPHVCQSEDELQTEHCDKGCPLIEFFELWAVKEDEPMGILTGNEIRIQQELGGIYIQDFDESRLNPNSYNLRLAPELLVYTEAVLDPKQDNRTRVITIPEEGYVLRPGTLYLAKTLEWTETRDYVPKLEGRSSIGRLGLAIHITAGFGDVGFKGNWTLELECVQPVKVYPGMEICQISYHTACGEVLDRYHGKYQGSTDVVASRIWREME